MKNLFVFMSFLIAFSLTGCARIEYVKVPTPTQYDSWSDEQQKAADEMEGVRYYLPRPFLHLKQSVPVAQRTAFVSFRFDEAQGSYVLVLPSNPPNWLKAVAPEHISIGQALAATLAKTSVKSQDKRAKVKQQSGSVQDDPEEPATDSAAQPRPSSPSTLKAETGFINQADPVTRLSGLMDVVYFPDFEEQYVIRTKAGLGTADITTRLRNGWAAEVFAQEVDNSQLIPYVVEQVENVSQAASGIVTEWLPMSMGLPPGTSPETLLQLAGVDAQKAVNQMQAGGVTNKAAAKVIAKDILGEILLFKIAEVRIAQPGIYPILKPREIRQWLKYNMVVRGEDFQESFRLFLEQSKVPWIRPDMAFIPCPPFTMVGFNATTDVYLAAATERAVDSGQKASGDIGGVNLTDSKELIREVLVAKKDELGNDKELVTNDKIVIEKTSSSQGTVITVTAPPNPAKKFTTSEADLKNWVVKIFKPQNTVLDETKVTVKLSSDKKKLTITFKDIDIAELGERAKKVK
ncbi:MAG: hypothetical protein MI892_28845 [Desulfobacterales bacterium]|nr:hypothetical protein [Desulfobacterales bacterium]